MIYLALLPIFGIQLWLCIREERRIVRLLPLLSGLVLALIGWVGSFFTGPTSPVDFVAWLILCLLLGLGSLAASGLAWLVYGVVKVIQNYQK